MAPKRYPSDDVSSSPLGEPLKFPFSSNTAPNRLMKAAMTERLSTWDPKNLSARGIPSPELINVYRRWGEGGYGMILTGNIMIHPEELEAAGNAIIPLDAPFSGERFGAFKKLATAAKSKGGVIYGQVSHPGRQVSDKINKHPISASGIQLEGEKLGMTYAKPRAATAEDIKNVINSFAHAAEFLHKAGYDGIELHGAHGYLLSQFISPVTNQRTDKYGGSLENRSRIILEIAQEIQRRLPESFGIAIKINSVEFEKGGFNVDECRQLCATLDANRFDFVELSGGSYNQLAFSHVRESTRKREAFFLDFADTIVPALKKTKIFVTGGFRTVGAMVKALDTIDGVGLGRPATQEFRLPNDILAGKVRGAIQWGLDENNFPILNMAGGTLIKMVSKDQEPFDLSQKENIDMFFKSMGSWQDNMSKDEGQYCYGYVDIEGFKPNVYGETYTSTV